MCNVEHMSNKRKHKKVRKSATGNEAFDHFARKAVKAIKRAQSVANDTAEAGVHMDAARGYTALAGLSDSVQRPIG